MLYVAAVMLAVSATAVFVLVGAAVTKLHVPGPHSTCRSAILYQLWPAQLDLLCALRPVRQPTTAVCCKRKGVQNGGTLSVMSCFSRPQSCLTDVSNACRARLPRPSELAAVWHTLEQRTARAASALWQACRCSTQEMCSGCQHQPPART